MRWSQTLGAMVALALMALLPPSADATPIVGGGLPRRQATAATPNGLYRTMRPVRRSLEKRGRPEEFTLQTSSLHLEFIEEVSIGSSEPFVATIRATPYRPTVMLEDLEGPLLQVRCFRHGIGLTFASSAHAVQASKAWGRGGFVVITNHAGCNVDGERVPFSVADSTLHHASSSIVLDAKPADWEDVAHSYDVEFGPRNTYEGLDMDSYRPSNALLARHDLEARDMTAHLNFNWSHKSMQMNNGGAYVKQICVECWATGTLTLTTGRFKLKKHSDVVVPAGEKLSLSHMAHSATVSLVSKNVRTRMHMETDFEPGLQASWPLLIEPVPLFGFDFVILVIGLKWDPQLIAKLQTLSPFKFHYGFDISVPDGSLLSIDLLSPGKSSAAGFHQANFTAMPFRVEVPRMNGFNVSFAYRNIVEFGISLGKTALNPFTVFEDIPQYDVSFEYMKGVDDTCHHLNSTTAIHPSGTGAAPASPSGHPAAVVHALASPADLDDIYAASRPPGAMPSRDFLRPVNYTRTLADLHRMASLPPVSTVVSSTSSMASSTTSFSSVASPSPPSSAALEPLDHAALPPLSLTSSTFTPNSFDTGLVARVVPAPAPVTPNPSTTIIPFHQNHVRITTGWSMDVRVGSSWDLALGYKMGPSLTLAKMVFGVVEHCMPYGPMVSNVPGAQAVGSTTGNGQGFTPQFTSWDGTNFQW